MKTWRSSNSQLHHREWSRGKAGCQREVMRAPQQKALILNKLKNKTQHI